jgi:peptidyl-prolyl cis-trans isomerase C
MNMKSHDVGAYLILAVIAAICVSGCGRKPSPDDKVLASVSSKTITLKDFNRRISKLPPYYQKIVDKDKKRFLDEIILEILLYEEAMRDGMDNDKEVKDVLREAKKKIITAKFIKTEIEDKIKIADDDIKRFYEADKGEFKTQPMWRASHILVATEREAKDVQAELATGADFAELAKAHSTDATASRGGDVGYFRTGQLIPDFEKECLKLDVGETSGIVHTQFGYHIIKLTDKKDSAVKSFEESKRDIEEMLKKQKRRELFDKLVLSLKEKYSVRIDDGVFQSLGAADKNAEKK